MKTQSQTMFSKSSKSSQEGTTVKGVHNNQVKTFSSVDLWNIHRQRRSIIVR